MSYYFCTSCGHTETRADGGVSQYYRGGLECSKCRKRTLMPTSSEAFEAIHKWPILVTQMSPFENPCGPPLHLAALS